MTGKACIISCSDHYHHRMFLWDTCLQRLGYRTEYITSDFDHATKQRFSCKIPGCVQLPVMEYRKNLSIERILSHRIFSKSAKAYLEQEKPTVVVALLPPNFLAHYLAEYKKSNPDVTLIFDIFDLWPETFPSGKMKRLLAPVFSVWAALRDRNLPVADYVVTECDLFRNMLKLDPHKSETVYLCAEQSPASSVPALSQDTLELCYLGSINNIISIPDICKLIQELSAYKPVTLHIIGKGEKEQVFIASAKAAGAKVMFYGPVYDPVKKQQIMDRCHLGINIMKSSVCIGLTMKSVDYFRHGLPIINSIPTDTMELVSKYGIGIPYQKDCAAKIAGMNADDFHSMRKNVETVFSSTFAQNIAEDRIMHILERLLVEVP